MTKRNWQLISAVVVLAACLPLPVAAEVHGAAKCANPSWSALAAGECGLSELHVLQQPPRTKDESSTDLVDVGNGSLVPEPETYALMLVGLVAVMLAGRKRRRL